MRFAKVTFALGLALFAAAAVGLASTWALAVSTVAMGLAGLVAVVVMEERDNVAVEGLYPRVSHPLPDVVAEPAATGLAKAA